jgi:hypothetical protein
MRIDIAIAHAGPVTAPQAAPSAGVEAPTARAAAKPA